MLDVLVDDTRVCKIDSGQTIEVAFPDQGGMLRVVMQSTASSIQVQVRPDDQEQLFECGSAWWVPFDFCDLVYIAPFKRRAFYMRRLSCATS